VQPSCRLRGALGGSQIASRRSVAPLRIPEVPSARTSGQAFAERSLRVDPSRTQDDGRMSAQDDKKRRLREANQARPARRPPHPTTETPVALDQALAPGRRPARMTTKNAEKITGSQRGLTPATHRWPALRPDHSPHPCTLTARRHQARWQPALSTGSADPSWTQGKLRPVPRGVRKSSRGARISRISRSG
jgi:hypothetical protein